MSCLRHPAKREISACKDCGAGFCVDCVRETDQTTYCFNCYRRRLDEVAREVSRPTVKKEEAAKAPVVSEKPSPRAEAAPRVSGEAAPVRERPREPAPSVMKRFGRGKKKAKEKAPAKRAPEALRDDFLAQGPDEDFSMLAKEKGVSGRTRRRKTVQVAPDANPPVAEVTEAPPDEEKLPPEESAAASRISDDALLRDVVSTLFRPDTGDVKPAAAKVVTPRAEEAAEKTARAKAARDERVAKAREALEKASAAEEAALEIAREKAKVDEAAVEAAKAEEPKAEEAPAEAPKAAKARARAEAKAAKARVKAEAAAAKVAGIEVEGPAKRRGARTAGEAGIRGEGRAERWSFIAQPRSTELTKLSTAWWRTALFVALMLLTGAVLWAVPNAYLIPKDQEYGIHAFFIGAIIGVAFWWKAGKKHGTKLAVQAALVTFFSLVIGEFLHWILIIVKNQAFRNIFFDLISFRFLWENGPTIMRNTIEVMFPVAFIWLLLLPSAVAFLVGFGMPPIPEIIFQIGRVLRGKPPEKKEADHDLEG